MNPSQESEPLRGEKEEGGDISVEGCSGKKFDEEVAEGKIIEKVDPSWEFLGTVGNWDKSFNKTKMMKK